MTRDRCQKASGETINCFQITLEGRKTTTAQAFYVLKVLRDPNPETVWYRSGYIEERIVLDLRCRADFPDARSLAHALLMSFPPFYPPSSIMYRHRHSRAFILPRPPRHRLSLFSRSPFDIHRTVCRFPARLPSPPHSFAHSSARSALIKSAALSATMIAGALVLPLEKASVHTLVP